MDKKLLLADLAERLAQRQGLSPEKAVTFVRAFFDITEEALLQDSYVKVTGFGTTKLVEVSERESVNVNTGERILIGRHAKVSFVPDVLLRDLVNAPFAFFTTTKLSDATTDEELEAVSEVELDNGEDVEEMSEVEATESPTIVEPVLTAMDETNSQPAATMPAGVEAVLPVADAEVHSDDVAEASIETTIESQATEGLDAITSPDTTVREPDGLASDIASQNAPMDVVETMPLLELSSDEQSDTLSDDEAPCADVSAIGVPQVAAATPLATSDVPQQVAQIDLQAEKKLASENRESIVPPADATENSATKTSAEITNIKGSIIVTSDQQQRPHSIHKWMIACFLLLILVFFLLGYLLGLHFGQNKPVDAAETAPAKQAQVVKAAPEVKSAAPVAPASVATETEVAKTTPVAEEAPAVKNSTQPTPAPAQPVAPKAQATPPSSQPAAAAASQLQQLPKGSYAIIGNLRAHTIGKGDNLYKLAAQVYGDKAFVSYIIVHNRIQNPDLVKVGQTIQLPRLAKKK